LNRQKAQNATATIEEAVARFLVFKKDNPSRRSSRIAGRTADSTMEGYKHLLGDVEPKSFEVTRKGRLFEWLETLNPRPVYISDLTNTLIDSFRATWDFPSDLTTSTNFTRLKTFFVYCRDRGRWIQQNPLDGVPRPTIQEGSRTAAFTDEQYSKILQTLEIRIFNSIGNDEKTNGIRRLQTLVELMRWGGLA
jgi:integrase